MYFKLFDKGPHKSCEVAHLSSPLCEQQLEESVNLSRVSVTSCFESKHQLGDSLIKDSV